MQPVTPPFRDPAPSRVAYRIHRLWLTPLFRTLLRVGLPAFIIVLSIGLFISEEENRAAIAQWLADMQTQFENRDEFMVRVMAIDGASGPVAEAVREMVPQRFPVSSFDLDLEAVRAEVETLDAVERARVRIRDGGVLQIQVTERVPAVVWRTRDGLELLDAGGHRVAWITDRRGRADLPLIAGDGADEVVPEALELIDAAAPISPRLKGLVRMGERRWDLVLDRGQRILLPVDDPMTALGRVLTLDQARELLSRDVAVVDLRLADRPTIRLNRNAVGELRRIRALNEGVTQE